MEEQGKYKKPYQRITGFSTHWCPLSAPVVEEARVPLILRNNNSTITNHYPDIPTLMYHHNFRKKTPNGNTIPKSSNIPLELLQKM